MTFFLDRWACWTAQDSPDGVPALDFLPSRTRKRMSSLSRIVMHVGHSLLEGTQVNDVVFASRFGEITRQLTVTEGLIEEDEVTPTNFSYSVFNTPVAVLSLTEGLEGITRAVYAGERSLAQGLMQSILILASGAAERLLFIMADEKVPDFYREIAGGSDSAAGAVGFVLSKDGGGNGWWGTISLHDGDREASSSPMTPADIGSRLGAGDGSDEMVIPGDGFYVLLHRDGGR